MSSDPAAGFGSRGSEGDEHSPHEPGIGLDAYAPGALVVLMVAAFVTAVWTGRNDWFTEGDWNLFGMAEAAGWFEPIEGHWSTVPMLLYRAMMRVFGLEYRAYLVVVVALHVATVLAVWLLSRRAGAQRWVATAVAAILLFYGPGFLSIQHPVQITQNISLAAGMFHLLLADHPGRFNWRDWLGLLLGAVGLMSSGVAPVLVMVVGVVVLIRRGWAAALFHTVPLGLAYLFWYLTKDPTVGKLYQDFYQSADYDLGSHARFVGSGITATLESLGPPLIGAVVVVGILAGGLWLAVRRPRPGAPPGRLVAPITLALGAVFYLGLVGHQRSALPGYHDFSHHLYNVAILLGPALAVAADAIARWHRWAAALTIVLLLAPAISNADLRSPERPGWLTESRLHDNRRVMLTIANHSDLSDLARSDPNRSVHPSPLVCVPAGWLAAHVAAGRVPGPPADPSPETTDAADAALRPGEVVFGCPSS